MKELCFWQAVNDINSGVINHCGKLYQLKAVQDVTRIDDVSE
jgi:hypothetical protein